MKTQTRLSTTAGGCDTAVVTIQELAGRRLLRVDPATGHPRGQLVFVHGLSEHAGRPLPFARRLAADGFRTWVPELAGHGAPSLASCDALDVYRAYEGETSAAMLVERFRDDTRRSAPGLRRIPDDQFSAMGSATAEDHLRQIDAVLEAARRLDPALPIFLAGHSMGGLLSLEAAWRWSERPAGDLRGVVLLSPALEPTPPRGKPLETFVLETAWKLRDLPFSPLRSAVKGMLKLNLPIDTTAGNRWVSDQPEEVALYAADPLIPHRLPSRYLSSIETQMARTARRGARLPVPGLLLVPGTDGITSADAALTLARAARRELGPDRMRVERFANVCAHDLLRSSARERVVACIREWMAPAVVPSSGKAA